jgi:hypothetical protein
MWYLHYERCNLDFLLLRNYSMFYYYLDILFNSFPSLLRWHTVTVTIDAEVGESLTYLDGRLDELQTCLSIPTDQGIWQEGTEVWVGAKPPMDLDAFGRSDSEGGDPRMLIMDVFVWGRCLSGDEIKIVHNSSMVDEHLAEEIFEDDWLCDESPSRVYFLSIIFQRNYFL